MGRVVPATLLVNPAAGRGGAVRKIAETREAFGRRNYCIKIVATESVEEFRSAANEALEDGSRTLIAMGGDGTMRLLTNEILANSRVSEETGAIEEKGPAGRDVLLGVIPAGGGNDFATALGIPKTIQGAVDVVVRGKSRMVDAVRVRTSDGRNAIYLAGGGIGLDALAMRYANGRFVKWPGRLRYVASAIAALRGFPGIEAEVEFSGTDRPKIIRRVLLAAVLNTPTFGGGLRIAPPAELDDGTLELALIEMLRKSEVLALLPRLLFTGELRTSRVVRARAAKIKLTSRSEAWFQGDGELLGRAPVEIEVLPRALRMLVP
jgi:diacylglycerol kinase (ATP)